MLDSKLGIIIAQIYITDFFYPVNVMHEEEQGASKFISYNVAVPGCFADTKQR